MGEIEMLITKNCKIEAEIKSLLSKNVGSEDEILNLNTKSFESKEETDSLSMKYENAELQIKKLTGVNNKAQEQIEYLNNKIKSLENKSKEEAYTSKGSQNIYHTIKLSAAEAKMVDYNEQIKALKLKSEELHAENNLLQFKIEKLKSKKVESENKLREPVNQDISKVKEVFTSSVFDELKREHKVIVDLHKVEVSKKENEIKKLINQNNAAECELIELKSDNNIYKSEIKY